MLIDRTNYELWFLDWFDGTLSGDQKKQLQHFLSENPDLKEEFAEFDNFRLNPPAGNFPLKNNLLKTADELSDSQFDYLCTAFVENEITGEEYSDLIAIVKSNPERSKTLELFMKTKLVPPAFSYNKKSKLRRRTLTQNAFRITIAILTAAAIIAFAIITYITVPQNVPENKSQLASTGPQQVQEKKYPGNNLKNNQGTISRTKKRETINQSIASVTMPSGDTLSKNIHEAVVIEKITVHSSIHLRESIPGYLITSNSTFTTPVPDDGRSKISKFLAKTFREKLLREKSPKDSPLNGFEIAKAGVSGLNLLLGWDMTLDEKKNETGELKSVYFSSKILKFNTAAKKSESLR